MSSRNNMRTATLWRSIFLFTLLGSGANCEQPADEHPSETKDDSSDLDENTSEHSSTHSISTGSNDGCESNTTLSTNSNSTAPDTSSDSEDSISSSDSLSNSNTLTAESSTSTEDTGSESESTYTSDDSSSTGPSDADETNTDSDQSESSNDDSDDDNNTETTSSDDDLLSTCSSLGVEPMHHIADIVGQKRPSTEPYREDFERVGQYLLAPLHEFCNAIGCTVQEKPNSIVIYTSDHSVSWTRNTRTISNTDDQEGFTGYVLPQPPVQEDNTTLFPIRMLAEKLGFNTRWDASTDTVSIYQVHDCAKKIRLRAESTIYGSDLQFSYFIGAHETEDYIYLSYDYSNAIVRFNKPDYTYSLISVPPSYGYIGEFSVLSEDMIYTATTTGLLLAITPNSIEILAGDGSEIPTQIGDTVGLSDLKAGSITRNVYAPDQDTIYFIDGNVGNLYAAHLGTRTATLIADSSTISAYLDIEMYQGKPTVLCADQRLVIIDPKTFEANTNKCFADLFASANGRVYSARHLPEHDSWLILVADSKEIVEARIAVEPGESCEIIRSTHGGDQTAFLNGLGTIEPDVGEPNQYLVIDSDGFNLIHYTLGGQLQVTTKQQLGAHANTEFIAPTSFSEYEGGLYIMANSTHQVVHYDLKQGTTNPVFGSGVAIRDAESMVIDSSGPWGKYRIDSPRHEINIGFSSAVRMMCGDLWIADNYSRRMLVDYGSVVKKLFDSFDYTIVGSITDFAVVDDATYMIDQASGSVWKYQLENEDLRKVAGLVNPQWTTSSEVTRRAEARKPIAASQPLEDTIFGLPSGIEHIDTQRFAVGDLYRTGVWILDLANNTAVPAIGFGVNTDYHFGSFTGNVGFSGQDVRLENAIMVRYDQKREVFIIPNGFGGSVVFVSKDLQKTCEAIPDNNLVYVTMASFLDDGRLAIVDSARSKIVIYDPPNMECMNERI